MGTHRPNWLKLTNAPLFVSRRTLVEYRTLPRAIGPWCLDSGGFSEISLFGAWQTPPAQYAAEVRRFSSEIGHLRWAAIQDWMCEPHMIQRTGLSVVEHQRRTVRSFLELSALAPEQPWTPVLQGWNPDGDYERHWELYHAAGVDLEAQPIVGLGSVCRRQATGGVAALAVRLSPYLRLHGFGLKLSGLRVMANHLASADSMAWSYAARRGAALEGCQHKNCANCLRYALRWREQVIGTIAARSQRPEQMEFFLSRPESIETTPLQRQAL